MEIPVFLAMTAGEVLAAEALPQRLAWMACHFSAYGTGLSNLPKNLPAGSMLMLNDRTPICGHDPALVAKTLCEAAERFHCDSILLDFQREGCEEAGKIIEAVLQRASCPVGISALYAKDHNCPVLVPPVAPHVPVAEALVPWTDREIWLELATEGTQITITTKGSQYTSLPFFEPGETAHKEETLHCHYEITVEEDRIVFQLGRTEEALAALLEESKQHGVTRAVGLWQELG